MASGIEKAPGILITPLRASFRASVLVALPSDHSLHQLPQNNRVTESLWLEKTSKTTCNGVLLPGCPSEANLLLLPYCHIALWQPTEIASPKCCVTGARGAMGICPTILHFPLFSPLVFISERFEASESLLRERGAGTSLPCVGAVINSQAGKKK